MRFTEVKQKSNSEETEPSSGVEIKFPDEETSLIGVK